MASARTAALQARKGYSPYSSSGAIKILAPVSTGISSIAKQNAANELDIKIAQYNVGLVGNEEMKAFLQTQLGNSYISASDKAQIQAKLLDFDSLIEKDRLEAAFKSAPENSLAKTQAATALVAYYKARAGTMQAGTPAQSQALENAASWQNQVNAIQESTNKQQRKNLQYELLQNINQLENSSSEKSMAKAAMYQKLYDLAVSQGDVEDAQVYAANYQQELSNAQAYYEQEAVQAGKETRRDLVNELNIAKNDYTDGKISAEQYFAILSAADQYAVENQDGTLQNWINGESSRVAKLEAKGGPNRGTLYGMPVVLKGTAGTGGGTVTDWDQQAFNYSDNIRLATEMLNNGQFDATKFKTAEEQYQAILTQSLTEYATALDEEMATVTALAQENPNQKIYFEGKKTRVADVVERLQGNMDDIEGQVMAINNGTAALMEIPPKESSKNPNAKAVTTYAFVDMNNLQNELSNGLIVPDTSGILHSVVKDTVPFMQLIMEDPALRDMYLNKDGTVNQTAVAQAVSAGGYYDGQGIWRTISKDSKSGIPLTDTGKQYVETYEPGGTRKVRFENTGEEFAPWNETSWKFEKNKAEGEVHVEGPEAIAMQKKAKDIQAQQEAIKTGTQPALQKQLPSPTTQAMQNLQQGELGKVVTQAVDTGTKAIQGVGKQITSSVQPVIQKAYQTVSTTAPTTYVANKVAQAAAPVVQPVVKAVQSYNPIQTLTSNVQKAAQAVQSYNPIQTFQSNVQKATNVAQNIGTTIKNTASNVWNWLTGKR